MFRDKDEELQRLQEQLLEEEEVSEEVPEEEDDLFDGFEEEEDPGEDPQVYRNFSNDYGKGLRNFASGYKAYNGDTTDVDLEQFSEDVQRGPAAVPWLLIVILVLMAVVVGAIAWFCIRTGGWL